jgi:hypothetical protein
METSDEIVQVIDRLQGEFEDLAVRGLRTAGASNMARLRSLREEFERIGAGHLARRISILMSALETGDRAAAAALLRAAASLRVFKRVLTLNVAGAILQGAILNEESEP